MYTIFKLITSISNFRLLYNLNHKCILLIYNRKYLKIISVDTKNKIEIS